MRRRFKVLAIMMVVFSVALALLAVRQQQYIDERIQQAAKEMIDTMKRQQEQIKKNEVVIMSQEQALSEKDSLIIQQYEAMKQKDRMIRSYEKKMDTFNDIFRAMQRSPIPERYSSDSLRNP